MRRALILPVLASAALTACGGSDAPTKAEFARNADKVCGDIEKAGKGLGSPDSVEELSSYADKAVKTIDDGVGRLKKLEVPDGKAGDQAEEFVSAVESDAEKLRSAMSDLKSAVDKRDQQAITAAGKKIDAIDTSKADGLAKQLGANVCAS